MTTEKNEICKWVNQDISEYFETECDNAFGFNCDGIKENNFKYCPYCGGKIQEVTE